MFQCTDGSDAAMYINYKQLFQQVLGTVRHRVPYFTRRLHHTHTHIHTHGTNDMSCIHLTDLMTNRLQRTQAPVFVRITCMYHFSPKYLLKKHLNIHFVVLCTHNSFSDRNFSAAGPHVWNALLLHLWPISLTQWQIVSAMCSSSSFCQDNLFVSLYRQLPAFIFGCCGLNSSKDENDWVKMHRLQTGGCKF